MRILRSPSIKVRALFTAVLVGVLAFGGPAVVPAVAAVIDVNPTPSAPKTTIQSPTPGFGYHVSVSGDFMAIGSPSQDNDRGAVEILYRDGTGTWKREFVVTPGTRQAGAGFGAVVSIDGTTLVVGAPNEDVGSVVDSGAVYFFDLVNFSVVQRQRMTRANGIGFGQVLDLERDTVAVGEPRHAGSLGSVSIFQRGGGSWVLTDTIDGQAAGAELGASIGLSGSTILAGAPGQQIAGQLDRFGAVHVITGNSQGWDDIEVIRSPRPEVNADFGISVAIDGENFVAGASSAFGSDAGAAYVFHRNGSTWTSEGQLVQTQPFANESFGSSVAIAGERVLVGAVDDYFNGDGDPTEATMFERGGTTWSQVAAVTPSAGDSHFGAAVALTDGVAVVTAPASRAVYLYEAGGFRITDVTVGEIYSEASLFLTRTGSVARAASVDLATLDGTATAGDYEAQSRTVTFPAGSSTQLVDISLRPDYVAEATEVFTVRLSNAKGAVIDDGVAQVTIEDDDQAPTLSVSFSNGTAVEGNTGTSQASFNVVRNGALNAAQVTFRTVAGTATAGKDYKSVATTLTWAEGDSSIRTVNVPIIGDTAIEGDEIFTVMLLNASGAAVESGAIDVPLVDNDSGTPPPVSLSINDVSTLEGAAGTTKNLAFKITRTGPTTDAVSVNFTTADSMAVAPGDYTAKTGTATIPAGAASITVKIVIKGDATVEPNESFSVLLSSPTGGATISKSYGDGVITNDD